jgi:predicted nuclease of restriction endonuclease-like RecB superfamily
MLPSSLLAVYKRKGAIQPRYAKFTPENTPVAFRLIEAYTSHVGDKKKALTAFVTELENQGYEYRFVRALALLLDRKSVFVCNSKINPAELRKKIFQTTEKYGLATTPEKRQQILNSVAHETGLTTSCIEEQLYADLDSELILEKFDPPSALELLQHYNLSLAQTLLFNCTELNFQASGNWQKLFYFVKKLGLIYEVSRDGDFWVKIDGPASLFKLTKRYGINIAKLLPVIISNQQWTLNAKIFWKYTNEICSFSMESTNHSSLFRKPKLQMVTYDSTDEERFANQFKAVNSGWTLKREPEPVLAGNQVIVPDFSLERSNLKVYLEIIGFWTEEYLRRKAEKLQKVNVNMLLVVNDALACEKLLPLEKRPQLHFIYYHDKISLAPILRYLQTAFEEVKTKETAMLENLDVTFTEPIVLYTEFAERIGVSVEAVQSVLTANPPTGYLPTHNSLVSQESLQQIRVTLDNALKPSGKLTLNQATQLIEATGVTDASCVLNHLGYKIVWHGINSEHAEVLPAKNQQ